MWLASDQHGVIGSYCGVKSPVVTEIEFCLLGSVRVRHRGVVVPLSPGKQRTVLATLLLNVGRVVSLDELAEVLWAASPPSSARVTLQNYVMRLRKALGGAGSRIRTQPGGYVIKADVSELDVSRFQAHLDAACAAAGERSWKTAAAEARAGLALWRGEPLADVKSELLAVRDAPRLAGLRLRALEIRLDADLHLGRDAEVITELQHLAGCHPLREQLHGMLMLALYRDGRQAEALAAYQHVRDVLVEELGIEPGTHLRDLHQRMLAADPALAITEPARHAQAEPQRVIPRELSPAVPGFTGPAAELQALTQMLEDVVGRAGTVVISAIGGTAGVGKTALAVHWAHQAADRFPDGQLYVNLRGNDPGPALSAAEALAGFLRALGVPGQDIPAGEDERAARYRSLLAGKQVLVVLDNAGSAGQVRPLLPATPSCAVVVTSRDALAGLVARDDGARLDPTCSRWKRRSRCCGR
jgi:DNA-binding SARP family transcriptional activator